jgi:AraC family transcriptional regulator of adaptative response / methylphosphotriester-DNA alkyltransferase methyltransferase
MSQVYSTNGRATFSDMATQWMRVDRPAETVGGGRRRALFEEALSVMELSYDDDALTVADLSQKIFTSPRQLQRAFAEAGTSFQQMLHAVRMQRSAELLAESSLSVAQIARLVGYRQPPQFAKAFRRYYHLTPTEWRNQLDLERTDEVISMDCQCGCNTQTPPEGSKAVPRGARDENERDLERRLEDLDRRLQELDEAA